MNYGSDRESTNVETPTPLDQLPLMQRLILQYLSPRAGWPPGNYYAPAPDMLPQPFGGRLDMGRNLPIGRFDWGQGLKPR